jgi:hypothetical protein
VASLAESIDDLVGTELSPLSRAWSMEVFKLRHELVYGPGLVVEEAWPERNIHSDDEAAQREGLPAAVASAPQAFSLVHRMMLSFFAEGWLEGGKISVKMIKPLFVHDYTTAKARITGVTLEQDENGNERRRAHCEVRVERRDHVPVMVGTASAVVRGAER